MICGVHLSVDLLSGQLSSDTEAEGDVIDDTDAGRSQQGAVQDDEP